jgi:hypothetical protein
MNLAASSRRDIDDASAPELARILNLIDRDIATRPGVLVPLPEALVARIERLTAGVAVDLDAPIVGDVVL